MDLQILHMYQSLRETHGAILTPIFIVLTNMGAETLNFLICAIIYWCLSKQLGQRILMATFAGGVFNQTLKNTFCVYRPWVRDTTIIPEMYVSGYSFPSGHSQMSMGTFGNIFLACRKSYKLVAALAGLLVILIPISRNYLCVHTPQDIIAGSLLGVCCIYIFNRVLKWADERKNGDLIFFAVSIVIMALHLVYVTVKSYPIDYNATGEVLVDPREMTMACYAVCGMAFGVIFGWLLEKRFIKFEVNVGIVEKIIRAVLGGIGFIVVSKVAKAFGGVHDWLGPMLYCFCLMFYITFIWPLIFNVFDKMLNKKVQE